VRDLEAKKEGMVTVTSTLEEIFFGEDFVKEKLEKEESFEKEVRHLIYQTPVTADLARQLFKEGCLSPKQLEEINELIFTANLAFSEKSLEKATKMVNDAVDKCLEKKRRA
jgi:hypothetical protein